jgi:hypothetical protein
VDSDEGGDNDAVAVGGDQLGDVALIEAVAQAPRRFALGLGASGSHGGLCKMVLKEFSVRACRYS